MAVTTRAGFKRGWGKENRANGDAPEARLAKKLKTRRIAKREPPSLPSHEDSFRFLDLPSEIRNLIYSYADERAHWRFEEYIPLLSQQDGSISLWPISLIETTSRKFYGLSQVCQQLRSEYWPIWLSTWKVRITPDDIEPFLQTFYPLSFNISPAHPLKQLQISWNHEKPAFVTSMSLLSLLELRAMCPSTQIDFAVHAIEEFRKPTASSLKCFICRCRYGPVIVGSAQEGHCQHQVTNTERHTRKLEEEYRYLEDFNQFLAYSDEEWLSDVREKKFVDAELEVGVGGDKYRAVVRLMFTESRLKAILGDGYYGSPTLVYSDRVGFLDQQRAHRRAFKVRVGVQVG